MHIDINEGRSAPLGRYGRHLSHITDHICLPKYHETRRMGSYIEPSSSYFWSLQRVASKQDGLPIKGGVAKRYNFKFVMTFLDGADQSYEEIDEKLNRIYNTIPYF